MLKIYDLAEYRTEDEIDNFIEYRKSNPIRQFSSSCWNLNTVVEDDSYCGAFYLVSGGSAPEIVVVSPDNMIINGSVL